MVKIKKRPRLGEDTVLGDHTYRYLTADEMKSLGDDSLPIDVTRDERIDSNRIVTSADSMLPSLHIEDTISPEHISKNYVEYIKKYTPDNVDIARHPISHGFLVSFLVDARGGAMRGCRHSGVKVIVPSRCAPSPTRITCRYVRPQRTPHPPPLMEGEALASRVLELGPVGAKFLGPVIIEVPHFAALRGKEREIVILRSDNGDSWKEHTVEATEEVLNDVLHDSFEAEDLNQLEDISSGRITRIVTQDFPQYFAVVSRVRQEVHAIGPEGGMVSSTVVPQVQAIFPEGALTKKIKVGLQAQPIDPELTAKLLGHGVAVSPVVTVEPRRRKFHKAIRLNMPAPTAHSQGMINQYSGSAPTLRLLCSITGGTTRAQWEDVTGSTPLTFVNDVVSFTTTVSARFWLMDCRNIGDATKMATELYKEVIHVPFMAKFVVFAKRVDPLEARLRVFCMTDDKEDKTLEHQEHFTEVAKSRDVEVLEGKPQYIEFSGNLVPITKSGEQLQFSFRAFRENRLPFSVKVKDQHAEAVGRCLFMKEAKVQKGEPPQQPICILNIVLPDDIVTDTISLTDSDSIKRHMFLSESYDYYRPDPRLADMSNLLGDDWVELAHQLGLTSSEINVIKSEYPESTAKQAQSMLRMWLSQSGNKAQTNTLENALKRIGREDIIPQCLNVEQPSHTITRIKQEEIGYRLSEKEDKREKKEEPRIIDKNRIDSFDKYSAEEKFVEKSESEEEDFDKTVPELREEIEKRLSAERAIPASSQRREIVQEITSIKQQTLVEEKLAEVQQKEPEVKIITTTTRISPDKTLVSESIEQKTTIPSKPKDSEMTVTETTTTHKVLSPTQVGSDTQEKVTHKITTTTTTTTTTTDQHDTELLEGVTQSFEVAKRIGPKIVTDDDLKSPKFSKTPPPSPADFLIKEKQATTAQEWDALGKPTVSRPATVGLSAAQQGISTTTTQYLASNEDKALDQNKVVANLKPIIDQTNALIQFESQAEPYHRHTKKHYQLKNSEDTLQDSSLSDSTKEEKKPKRGFFGTLKTFVGKSSTDHSDSDSERAPKKEKVKKQKKKKKIEFTDEAPIPPPRKPKYPSPKIGHKEYPDIPYFEASPDEEERHSKPPVPPRTDKCKSKKEIPLPELPDKIIKIKLSPVPTEIEHQAKAFVDGIVIDSENVAKTVIQKSPKDEKKKKKVVVIEEQITKTFAPAAIEEEEFTVVIDPTRKESPKKSRETFTLNIHESIDDIEKEILEKSPILSEETIVKPFAHINDDIRPERPPRTKPGVSYYEHIDDTSTNLSHSSNKLLIIQDWYEPHSVAIKNATTDLIANESIFTAWAEDPHNVCNKQSLKDEAKEDIKGKADNQKIKRKPKLFGLFGKTSRDISESEDESSKTEIIEKQEKEDSKEKTTHITKEEEEPKKGFRTIFGKKTKPTNTDSFTPQLSEKVLMDMINTSEFLKQEVTKYEDSSEQLKKDKVETTDLKKILLIKKAKSKEKSDKSFLGGIFKKTKKEEATTQEPVISENVIKGMNDTTEFLNEEVKKYHDIRPVTFVNTNASPDKIINLSSTNIKDICDSKEQKKDVKTSDVSLITTKIVNITTLSPEDDEKEKTIIVSQAALLDMKLSSAFLKGEVENYHDVYPISPVLIEDTAKEIKKGSKGHLTFPKKQSEEQVGNRKQVEESISEDHKEKIRQSDIFLKDEVENYHDVRPLLSAPVAEIVKQKTDDQQTVEAQKESKGILGMFKKKKHDRKSLEKEIGSIKIKPVLTEELIKTINDTNQFLTEEVTNYYDAYPAAHVQKPAEEKSLEIITQTETTKWYDGSLKKDEKEKDLKPKKESKGILGILKKKHDKPTESKEAPKLSDEAVRDMKDTDMFLKNEVVWHHDVYPIGIINEETHVEEKKQVSREPSKDRDIEKKESKKVFGIFQKKSEHAVEEHKTVSLSNTIIDKMKQTDDFVKTEVHQYHDVRPVISEKQTTLVLPDQESALQKAPYEANKYYDVKSEIQNTACKDYENEEKENQKKDTKTLFGLFKIRGKSESKDDEQKQDESKSIVLSKEVLLNMENSQNFLKDEIDNYHDVKPIIEDKHRLMSPETAKNEKKVTDQNKKESKNMFGFFNLKPSGENAKIKLPSGIKLSEKTIQDIQNSDNFLKQEVDKYHDVKPTIIKEQTSLAEAEIENHHEKSESKKILGIFTIKKDESKVTPPKKVEISEEAKRGMLNTNDFLELEIDKYHDVRPTVLKELPKSPIDKKETSAEKVEHKKETKKLFGLFKKKSSNDDTKTIEAEVKPSQTKVSGEHAKSIQDTDLFLKEEVDKYHDVYPFPKNELLRQEIIVSDISEIEKPVPGGSIFKIFKKESSPKKATPKLKLSQEAIQTLQICNDFLQKEVQKHHDVRPTKDKRLSGDAEKPPVPKQEEKKQAKKLFGLFKIKSSGDDTANTIWEASQKQVKESEESLKAIRDSDVFLKQEVDKYHDVWPGVESKIIDEEVPVSEVQQTEKTANSGGIFKIFKKESSPKKTTDKSKLSEQVIIDLQNCNDFLEQEVTKYHDVKPTVRKEQPIPRQGKKDESVDKVDDKKESKKLFGLLNKLSSDNTKDIAVEDNLTKANLSPENAKLIQDSDSFLRREIDTFHDVYSAKIKKTIEKEVVVAGISKTETPLSILEPKPQKETVQLKDSPPSESHKQAVTLVSSVENQKPVTSTSVENDMQSCNTFLIVEVQKYHDVSPIHKLKKETTIDTGDKIVSKKLFGGLLKPQEAQDDQKKIDQAGKEKTIHETNNFLNTELTEYEDSKVKQIPVIEKPKKELKIETQKAPPLSKEVIKDMIDTSNFIREEVAKYHDVRPAVKPLEVNVTAEKKTKSGKLFGLFGKKKSRDRSVERDVGDERPKKENELKQDSKDKKKMKEEVIKPPNNIISQTGMQNMEDSKKFLNGELECYEDAPRTIIKIPQDVMNEKIVKEKHSGFFGLFSKKTKPDKEKSKHDEEKEQELNQQQTFVESLNNTNAFITTEIAKYHDVRPVAEKPLMLPFSREGTIIKAERAITEKVEKVLEEKLSKIGNDKVETEENDENELRKKKKITTVIEEYTPHGEKTIRVTKELFAINPDTMKDVADLDEDIKVKIMEARKLANDPDRDTSKPFSRETFTIETKIIDRIIPVSLEKETVVEKQNIIKTTTIPHSQREMLSNIQPYTQDLLISPDVTQIVNEHTKDFLLNEQLNYEDANSQVKHFTDTRNISEDLGYAPEVEISKTKRSTAFGIFGKGKKSQDHGITEEQKQKSPKAKSREKIFGKPKSQDKDFLPESKEEIVVVTDVKDDKEKRDRKKGGSPFKFFEKPHKLGTQTIGKTETEDKETTEEIKSPKSPEKSAKHRQHEKRKSGGFLSFFTKESSKDEPQTKEDNSEDIKNLQKLTKLLTTEVKQFADTEKVEQQLNKDVKIFESEEFHKDDLEDKIFIIREKTPQVEQNITLSKHDDMLNSDVKKEVSDLDIDILDRIEKLKKDEISIDENEQYVNQISTIKREATINDTIDFLNNEQRNYHEQSKGDPMEKVGREVLGVKEESGRFAIFEKGKSQERELIIQDVQIPTSERTSQEREAPMSTKVSKNSEEQKKREKRKSGGFLSFFAKDSTEEQKEPELDSQHMENVCDTNKFQTMEVDNYKDAERVTKQTIEKEIISVINDITESSKGTLKNNAKLDAKKETVRQTVDKYSDVAKPSPPRDFKPNPMEHSQSFLHTELVNYEDAKPTFRRVQENISEKTIEKESKAGLFSVFVKSKSQEKEIPAEKRNIPSPEPDFDRKGKKGHKKHGGPFKIFDRKHNSEDKKVLAKSEKPFLDMTVSQEPLQKSKSQDKNTVTEIRSPKTEKRNKREKRKSGGILSFFTKESVEEAKPEVEPQHVHILNDTIEFLAMEVKNYEDVVTPEKKLSTEEPICQPTESLEDELLKERKVTTVTKEVTPHGEKTITVTKQMISIDPIVMKEVDDLDKDIIDKIEKAREEANSLSRDHSEPFVREYMTIETKIINREIPIVSEKETTTETITTISPTTKGNIKTTTNVELEKNGAKESATEKGKAQIDSKHIKSPHETIEILTTEVKNHEDAVRMEKQVPGIKMSQAEIGKERKVASVTKDVKFQGENTISATKPIFSVDSDVMKDAADLDTDIPDIMASARQAAKSVDIDISETFPRGQEIAIESQLIDKQSPKISEKGTLNETETLVQTLPGIEKKINVTIPSNSDILSTEHTQAFLSNELIHYEDGKLEVQKPVAGEESDKKEIKHGLFGIFGRGKSQEISETKETPTKGQKKKIFGKPNVQEKESPSELGSDDKFKKHGSSFKMFDRKNKSGDEPEVEKKENDTVFETETQKAVAEKQKKSREKRRSGGFLSLFSKDSESLDEEPKHIGHQHYQPEVIKVLQDTTTFLNTEIVNYEDGKLQMVTDLDEDSDVPKSGLFSLFSKKDKESPRATKKMFKKQKRDRSVDKGEGKAGLIEKITRIVTGVGDDEVADIKEVTEGTFKKFGDEVDEGIEGVQKTAMLDAEMHDESKPKTVTFIIPSATVSEQSSDDIAQDIGATVESAKVKIVDTKNMGIQILDETIKKAGEEMDKIYVNKRDPEEASDGTLTRFSETAVEAEAKVEGFLNKFGRTSYSPKPEAVRIEKEPITENIAKGTHHEDHKKDEDRKEKKVGFFSKIIGGKQKTKDVDTEIDYITKSSAEAVDDIITKAETEADRANPTELRSSGIDFSTEFAKNGSNFVDEILQSFDEKMVHVKEDREEELYSKKQDIEQQVEKGLAEETKQRAKKGIKEPFDFLENEKAHVTEQLKVEKCNVRKELGKYHHNVKEDYHQLAQDTADITIEKKQDILNRVKELQCAADQKITTSQESLKHTIAKLASETERLKADLESTQTKLDITGKNIKETTECIKSKDVSKKSGGFLSKLGKKLSGKTDTISHDTDHHVLPDVRKNKIKEKADYDKTDSSGLESGISTTGKDFQSKFCDTKENLTKANSEAKKTVLKKSKQLKEALEKTKLELDKKVNETTKTIETTSKQLSDNIGATRIEAENISEKSTNLKETIQILKGQLNEEADDMRTSVKRTTKEISNGMTEFISGPKAEITEKVTDIKKETEEITHEIDKKAQQQLEKTAKEFSEKNIETSSEPSQKLEQRKTDTKKSTQESIDYIGNTVLVNRIRQAVSNTAENADRVIYKALDNDNLQQKTSDFLESEIFSGQQEFYQMPRTVSDYGSSIRESDASTVPNISEANIDLSNLPKNVESRESKYGTSAYITSPTAARRAASQRFPKGERPEVIEVKYTYSDDVSSDDSYIVTEPDEVTEKKSKKPLFHIESEDDDSFLDSSKHKLTERSESVRSNILETLTEHEVDDLLSNLTKDLDEATKSTKEVFQTVVQKEDERLEEHKKAEVDLIERKLRDLDIALDFLEQDDHKISTELSDDPKREKKLKRVERKFERMASEALDKELAEAKHKEIPTPDVEEKRENDFQSLVSQLSVEEVLDFQKEYSHIWDENTFSKSDGLDSKTPDSQADAQELPKGDDKPTDSQKPTSSTSQAETEESQDSQKGEKSKSKAVADQHQLSGEMKELLKELEKESKQ